MVVNILKKIKNKAISWDMINGNMLKWESENSIE